MTLSSKIILKMIMKPKIYR